MSAAPAAAPAAASTEAVQPSLAEQLSAFGRDAWAHLTQLDPGEAGLNFLVSAAILLGALGLIWLLRRLFDHWVRRFADSCNVEVAEAEKKTSRAAGLSWALARILILGAALLLVISVWGIDPWAWISGEAGARLVRLALILVLVTALVEVAGFVTRRFVEGFASRSRDGRRAAQIRSLGPLLTGSIQGVLIVVGLLTFLSELGLQVGPLLASAGVVGLAVGFGAQTLVKDFLTGVFLIAEDAVSVGDNVRIGDASGTVEAMTLRTIRLRNMNGTLHIFPYSEAQVIHNRTKLFSSYLFDLQISYDADIDRALSVMGEVAEEMRADAEFGPMITRPFDILGVDKLGDSGVVLKARVTTTPKDQWKVGREYNRRIKLAFDREGIEIPFPTVQLVAPKPPMKPQAGEGAVDRPAGTRSFAPPESPPRS
ncbi:mechanosensitive ion channel family protein [Phenylobacterium sp.]|uniref:mechanosensitive ion channel family protein n=1 Tax=Phenylobacterium sp. TaxID=1871053 RepID=UPI002D192AB3|nr:mechanosensitive ion channel family protein [Phenylobacterium sp.]HVI33787.1 mechanosensitive ion channel family protein [Phenylobacterium sp.]